MQLRSHAPRRSFALTLVAALACGSETNDDPDPDSGSSSDSVATADDESTDDSADAGESGTTSADDAADSSTGAETQEDTGADSSSGSTDTGGQDAVYAAVVRGTLAGDDLDASQATHDAIAMMGEDASMAAGDFAHDVLLGTTLLDSTENEFLAIDRWDDADAMQAFYADPQIGEAFGTLFAAPPTIEYFELAPAWVSWGDMESGDAYDPYFFHFALGDLAQDDEAANQMAHDQVAAGGMDPSIAAGNVAHVVFLGLEDRQRFLAVDIWQSDENIEAFYTNPMFVEAFAPLFTSVTQPVFVSTDWYQW